MVLIAMKAFFDDGTAERRWKVRVMHKWMENRGNGSALNNSVTTIPSDSGDHGDVHT